MIPVTLKRRILVVEHDDHLRSMMRESLESMGFEVVMASNESEILGLNRKLGVSLTVLDMDVPGMSGRDVLRELRTSQETQSVRVIVTSRCAGEIDRIVCLELGADDFVAKPLSPRELALRVRAILGRQPSRTGAQERIQAGRFTLDVVNRVIQLDGQTLKLTAMHYRLLAALITEAGRVLPRGQLVELAWAPDSKVAARTVDTQLRRLRVKLGSAAAQIRTVRGFGYVLEG